MATVLSTLYPPLIDTFMPAFLAEGPAVATFSISPYNTNSTINRIHVSLVSQQSNLNAFGQNSVAAQGEVPQGTSLIDGVWIIPKEEVKDQLKYDNISELWTLKIPRDLLRKRSNSVNTPFSIDGYYKLQLRFDDSPNPIDNNYLVTERAHFSEWSSVCLLKAIPTPKLVLTDFINDDGSKNAPVFNPGLIPIAGKVYFDDNLSGTYEETMRSYKISIYPKDDPDDILDSIGPVYTGNSADQNNIYWLADGENAEPGKVYTLKVTVTTKNQYTFSEPYDFKIYAYDSTPFTPEFNFKRVNLQQYNNLTFKDPADFDSEVSKIITEEDGAVVLTVKVSESMPPGYLYIKRATSLDNYRHWELISCTKENGEVSRTIEDYTVGSLVRYKYSAQYQTKKGGWTRSKTSDDIIYPDFYDMLFYRDGRQLAVRYNGQITNLRPIVNRQKIDTLGGRYPKFAENAKMNYKQFSISGLIDAESDFNRKFLDDRDYSDQMSDYNSQMNGKYEIRNDTIADGELAYQGELDVEIKRASKNTYHDLYPKNNWWLEREFREQAIRWLNDGEPKLFRSMTEGNMAVMLTDISLTPNATLGRRVYNFSATMYEVEDGYSLETLNSLGIVSIVNEKEAEKGGTGEGGSGSEEQDSNYLTKISVGQIPSMKFPRLSASVVKGSMTGDTSNTRGLDINYISIEDLYNFIIYDQESVDGKLYQVVPNSIKLKDVRLRFESKPRWYQFTDSKKIKLVTASTDPSATSDKDIQLGYKIALNISETGTAENDILIFVNERGYYQVPTNLDVTNIKIYDGATATIDYKIEYQIQYNDSQIPRTTDLARKVIGQLSGVWRPNTRLSSRIKRIHRFLQYDSKDRGKLIMSESLTNWHALSLELTPYSVVSISFEEDNGAASDFNNYLVGRTGIYNLVDDYPIKEVIILGKRMVQVDNSRQRFLDDWEFVLDDSAREDKSSSDYALTWNEFINRKIEETNILVEINEKTTTAEEEGINRLWNNFDNEQIPALGGYAAIPNIKQPQSNTVYGIKDGNKIKYMIYYQDAGWYDIEFVPGSNQTIALAKVPVHGMINYWVDIMRQTF